MIYYYAPKGILISLIYEINICSMQINIFAFSLSNLDVSVHIVGYREIQSKIDYGDAQRIKSRTFIYERGREIVIKLWFRISIVTFEYL